MSSHVSHLSALLLAVALGALAVGLVAGSWPAASVGIVVLVVLAASYPAVRRMAEQVADRPTKTGMAALVGQHGEVERWTGATGTVLLQGSLWNAVGPAATAVHAGDEVEVTGWSGSTLNVTTREQA